MHPSLSYLAVLLMLGWSAAAADGVPDLYQARARVTGQTAEGRAPAIARCLTEVLVKVSGDSRLLDDPRVAAAAKQAGALVTDVRYRDLMAGLPTNDEQGTRDRPYELTVAFHAAGVDALLRTLGREPWTAPRPRVAIFLEVRQSRSAYSLTSDGDRGAIMREALKEAAARVGLPAVLPSRATQAQAGSSRERWLTADRRRLGTAARVAGGDVALAGRLLWSDAALGWIADWRLATESRIYRWRIRGVSFDDAFRSAMRGAVQVRSGHGQPKS